ncbi:CBS domain-containing protein [Streptomyces sp. NPDC057438]|uniref:CBS domain-containing protein n=1 Tax=Streptomyces sp. NPDC057438 TaxID=3346133 RepID=UPI00367C15ED
MRQWTVRDVMTAPVVWVGEDTTYREIVSALAECRGSALPVLDDHGRVVGVVSEADVLRKVEFAEGNKEPRFFERPSRRAARAKAGADLARDLMSTPPVTIGPDEPVTAAARLMESRRVKRLPVVDGERRLVGIVSRRDLMKTHLRPDSDIRDDIVNGVFQRALWADPAGLTVDVRDGVVELRGQLDRHNTAIFAVLLAEQVPGVVQVVDHLSWQVDDSPRSADGEPT